MHQAALLVEQHCLAAMAAVPSSETGLVLVNGVPDDSTRRPNDSDAEEAKFIKLQGHWEEIMKGISPKRSHSKVVVLLLYWDKVDEGSYLDTAEEVCLEISSSKSLQLTRCHRLRRSRPYSRTPTNLSLKEAALIPIKGKMIQHKGVKFICQVLCWIMTSRIPCSSSIMLVTAVQRKRAWSGVGEYLHLKLSLRILT